MEENRISSISEILMKISKRSNYHQQSTSSINFPILQKMSLRTWSNWNSTLSRELMLSNSRLVRDIKINRLIQIHTNFNSSNPSTRDIISKVATTLNTKIPKSSKIKCSLAETPIATSTSCHNSKIIYTSMKCIRIRAGILSSRWVLGTKSKRLSETLITFQMSWTKKCLETEPIWAWIRTRDCRS